MTPAKRNLAKRVATRRARFTSSYERAAFDDGMITGIGTVASYLVNTPMNELARDFQPMGDFSSSAIAALTQAGGALGTGAKVLQDPYLSEVLCRVDQLAQIEAGQKVTPCVAIPAGRAGGIGLRKVIKPLRAYVYAEQHPWVYPVAVGAIVGIPFLLGYLLAK